MLPPDLASAIQADAGAQNVKEFNFPIIDCGQSKNQTSLHFGFGGDEGPLIAVPKSELVIPRYDAKGAQFTYNGSAACEFGVWTSTFNTSTASYFLGDTFMRSAYVVRGPLLKHPSILKVFYPEKPHQDANLDGC